MVNPNVWLLSFIVFLPAAGALVLLLFPKGSVAAIKWFSLLVALATFVPALWIALPLGHQQQFDTAVGTMQNAFTLDWIPSFNIHYFLGLDGISYPLVALTAFVSLLAVGASWNIERHVKAYFVLLLLLVTGMLGVFLALDFFLFYVFWEVMLLPMYFLIGVWGGPRKEYAAIKFFLYTLVGSVLMLVAILMLYFASDLRVVARISDFRTGDWAAAVRWDDLHVHPEVEARLGRIYLPAAPGSSDRVALTRIDAETAPLTLTVVRGDAAQTSAFFDAFRGLLVIRLGGDSRQRTPEAVVAAMRGAAGLDAVLTAAVKPNPAAIGDGSTAEVLPLATVTIPPAAGDAPVHTFNLLALAAMGQHTDLFSGPLLWGRSLQWWAFVLLLIGFLIKVPSVPLHTWLPDAHVEAPTPISMILAGVLLKMGGYGIVRICYPICPEAGYQLAWLVCTIGVVSMIYGAFAALAQRDFKRLVAYSSVSHMGYVVLGLGVWSATAGNLYVGEYWSMGVAGAMFQMIAHGISSAGMFFIVGVLYDRVHHRDLDAFGGIFGKMPVYTALAIVIFFAGLGLPGLCGFIGEVLVVLAAWKYNYVLAVLAASVVILTAAYILWAIQRVYLGAEYVGPHPEALTPLKAREAAVALPLAVLAVWFGVFPHTVLRYMDATIDRQVRALAVWTERYERHLADVRSPGDGGAADAPPAILLPPVEQVTRAQPRNTVRPETGRPARSLAAETARRDPLPTDTILDSSDSSSP